MFIDFAAKLMFGAPAERNVPDDEYVELYISLRWIEEPFRANDLYEFGHSGTQRFGRKLCPKNRNLLPKATQVSQSKLN